MSSDDQNIVERLNRIIETQSRLAEADFDLKAFMELVVNQMQRLSPATGAIIELIEHDRLIYRAATGSVKKHLGLSLDMKTSFSGLCVRRKEILHSEDTENDTRVNLAACRMVEARSMLVAPLMNNGVCVGVLKILSNKPHAFRDIDIQTLHLMAGLIGSGLAHQIYYETKDELLAERTQMLETLKKAEDLLAFRANHDYLTHLPNRALFHTKLLSAMSRARAEKTLLGLMYLDIDFFKKVNDTYGHGMGDAVLQEFSKRLQSFLKNEDVVARFGGDEFVLLLHDLNDKNQAEETAKAILDKMQETYQLHNRNLSVTTSIGLTFFQGENTTADALLSQADQALYAAKQAGRNTWDVYNSEMIQSN